MSYLVGSNNIFDCTSPWRKEITFPIYVIRDQSLIHFTYLLFSFTNNHTHTPRLKYRGTQLVDFPFFKENS